MAIAEEYARAVWDAEHMLATWTPDLPLQVGDVVIRDDSGGLRVETTLAALSGVALPPVTDARGAASTLLHRGITVDGAVDGDVGPGTLRITFKGAQSFVFVGGRATLRSFSTLSEVRQAVLAVEAAGDWQRSWHVVTAVRAFSAGTVLVAKSDAVQASVQVAGVPVMSSLALLRAGARVAVTSGTAASFSLGSCTPFYEAVRIRRRFLGAAGTQSSTLGDPEGSSDGQDLPAVVRVGLQDSGLLGGSAAEDRDSPAAGTAE